MAKLAQFTMLNGESGRIEKVDIVVAANHVMLVRPSGTDASTLVLSNGTDIRVAGNVEQAFNKLVG